ncbi:MAG: hypothetical protein ACO3LT_01230 [Ilumatobacteraceae bacterium]|jgi:hypothetical protein
MALTISRGTNLVEYHESTPLTSVDDALEVHADSSEFTFAVTVTGGANFTLAFETNFNGGASWFELDTSKTINSNGQYIYFYTGKPSNKIRVRVASIASGTPSIVAHIGVAYHG